MIKTPLAQKPTGAIVTTEHSHAPEGTLTLAEDGRLSMKLKGGKILFDAPISQTKRKYERTYGYLRIVVGPRLYVLQFFTYGESPNFTHVQPIVEAQQKGGSLFKEWRTRLESYNGSAQTSLNKPIIAAKSPPTLHKKNMDLRSRVALLLISFILLIGVTLVVFTSTPLASPDNNPSVAVFAIICVGLLLLASGMRTVAKRRDTIDDHPLPASELQHQPDEVFPPNTLPTAGFGFTTGKQIMTGIVISFAIIIIIPVLITILSE